MKRTLLLAISVAMAMIVVSMPAEAALGECGGWIVHTDKDQYNRGETVEVSYEHVLGEIPCPQPGGLPCGPCGYLTHGPAYFWVLDGNDDIVAVSYVGWGPGKVAGTWSWDQRYTEPYGPTNLRVPNGDYTVHFAEIIGLEPEFVHEEPAAITIGGAQGWHGCGHGHASEHNPHCQ